MDVKWAAGLDGAIAPGDVRAFCREHGIGKSTFYKWRNRYRSEGEAGLVERSRRPLSSPNQTSLDVEDEVVRIRKELVDAGLDAGPWSIQQRLTATLVPSESTIWRILRQRGLIVPEPKKRPKSAWRRFVWARPNDLWQIDATHWELADGTSVEIIDIIDDHSRLLCAAVAVATCTSPGAWTTFQQAAATWGVPAQVLSDNGLTFNGSRRGLNVLFDVNLREAGVLPICSTPAHPQTCGKIERHHQTLKQWLIKQPAPTTLAGLQRLLDTWTDIYNNQRPHRALHGATPATVWAATAPAVPAPDPITDTTTSTHKITINAQGIARVRRRSIALGVIYANIVVTAVITGNRCAIFHDAKLVRAVIFEANKTHYPLGNTKRGGPRQQRLKQ